MTRRNASKQITVDAPEVLAIGRRIAFYRKAAGLTQTELAKRLGLTQGQLSQYELGISRVSADLLLKLARLFGVSGDELLGLRKPTTSSLFLPRHIARRMAALTNLPYHRQNAILRAVEVMIKEAQRR